MTFDHPALARSLRTAYSAEKAASLAYIGHRRSLRDPAEKARIRQIEDDEWDHRREVLAIMRRHGVEPSRWLEAKYRVIGTAIGLSCRVIGRFMPFFFAGKLESGNVCEYFVMMKYFRDLGVREHDAVLYDMGVREKEHEAYFLEVCRDERWFPLFERVFSWGARHSANDVDLDDLLPVERSGQYCEAFIARREGAGKAKGKAAPGDEVEAPPLAPGSARGA